MRKTDKPDSSNRELAERIFFRIYQCDNLIHRTASRALEDFDISSHQWIVIGSLAHPDAETGMTVGELARLLRVSRQSLTATLLRLEKRDLIVRVVSDGDARARQVQLTTSGSELYKNIQSTVNKYYVSALDSFSFDDHVTTVHFLNRLLTSLSEKEFKKDD